MWAYLAVVCGCVWPNNLPTIGSETPLETKCEAYVWRRSWMRTPSSLAILQIFPHWPFNVVKCVPSTCVLVYRNK